MRALYLVRNGNSDRAFEMREDAIPVPSDNEVCVHAEASGLNYADVMARMGLYEDCPKLPTILGYEVVGRIHALGKNVSDFSIGQRVVAFTRFGGYAEYAVTDYRAVAVIPDEIDAVEATALATQYTTAYYAAAEMTTLQKDDKVLIHAAAGGVGTALVQWAKHRGCEIFGTAGSPEKLDYLNKNGVHHPINYRSQDFVSVIKNKVGDRGLDVVFDSIGGTSVKKGRPLLGSGGRMICYGAAELSGKKSIFKLLKFAAAFGVSSPIPLLQHSKGIIGVNMLRIADNRPEAIQRCMKQVVHHWKEGVFKPFVGGSFKAEEIAKAHDFLGNRQSIGKIGILW